MRFRVLAGERPSLRLLKLDTGPGMSRSPRCLLPLAYDAIVGRLLWEGIEYAAVE